MIKERIKQYICEEIKYENREYVYYSNKKPFYSSNIEWLFQEGDVVEILKNRIEDYTDYGGEPEIIWVNGKTLFFKDREITSQYSEIVRTLNKILNESIPKKELSIYWNEIPKELQKLIQKLTNNKNPFR